MPPELGIRIDVGGIEKLKFLTCSGTELIQPVVGHLAGGEMSPIFIPSNSTLFVFPPVFESDGFNDTGVLNLGVPKMGAMEDPSFLVIDGFAIV